MKSLTVQIAEMLVTEPVPVGKQIPEQWRIQIPLDYDNLILFSSRDSYDFSKYWQIDITLPKGYSYNDYELALDQLFPDSIRKSDENNRSFRIIDRGVFERSIEKALNKNELRDQSKFEPIMRDGVVWYGVEGIGWIETMAFAVNPQEDDIDGGRSYFHVKTRDGKRHAIVLDERGAFSDTGVFSFEFEAAYTLVDPEDDLVRERIEIFKTVGAFGIRFTDQSRTSEDLDVTDGI